MTKIFLILSIVFSSLLSFQVLALVIQDDWRLEDGASLSKNDISMILERVGDRQVNGRKFDLEEVQSYFSPPPSDLYLYWERLRKYTKNYGNNNLAKLLLYTAMADFSIKQSEKRFKVSIPADQKMEFDSYYFNQDYRRGANRVFIPEDFKNACVIAATEGVGSTSCSYYAYSSGLVGASIYILSSGYFGSRYDQSEEYTTCISSKKLHVLVRTVNKQGQEVLTSRPWEGRGQRTANNEHVWFPIKMRMDAHYEAEQDYAHLKKYVAQYTCDRHRPTGNVSVQPLEKITDIRPVDLDNDDVIDDVLVPVLPSNARNESPAFDLAPAEDIQRNEAVSR